LPSAGKWRSLRGGNGKRSLPPERQTVRESGRGIPVALSF
jgi:hypothetical protein